MRELVDDIEVRLSSIEGLLYLYAQTFGEESDFGTVTKKNDLVQWELIHGDSKVHIHQQQITGM